jgi:hypothetical protein
MFDQSMTGATILLSFVHNNCIFSLGIFPTYYNIVNYPWIITYRTNLHFLVLIPPFIYNQIFQVLQGSLAILAISLIKPDLLNVISRLCPLLPMHNLPMHPIPLSSHCHLPLTGRCQSPNTLARPTPYSHPAVVLQLYMHQRSYHARLKLFK